MAKYIANILTGFRILGSVLLLFFPAFSVGFYIIYLFCGFSDMIDGTIARKTNSTSEFGAKIDTVADLLFAAASIIRLLPAIHIPGWLWIWGGGIAVIKISNIILGYASKKTADIPALYYEQDYGIVIVSFALNIVFCRGKIQFCCSLFHRHIGGNPRRCLCHSR